MGSRKSHGSPVPSRRRPTTAGANPRPLRCAIYARVSTQEQANEGTSLSTQIERCRTHAATQGWDVVGEFIDEGVSGTLVSRPALNRLWAEVRAGRVDVVIVAKLDRFFRNARGFENGLHDLDEHGVALVSVAESLDTETPGGRMMRSMFGIIAAWERETIADRTIGGSRATAQAGFWNGGPAPYGYQLAEGPGKKKTLIINDAEAEVIRLGVRLVTEENCSTWEALQRLNALGLGPRRAPRWTPSNFRRLMVSDALVGRFTWSKKGLTGGDPVHLQFERIISDEQHARLREAVDARSPGRFIRDHVYLLRGRGYGVCGGRLQGCYRHDRDLRQYRCFYSYDTVVTRREQKCECKRLRADDVEFCVWEAVTALVGDPDRLLVMAGEFLEMRGPQMKIERDQVEVLDRKLAELDRALAGAYASGFKSGLDADAVRAATELLAAERAALMRHRDQVASWQEGNREASDRSRELWRLAEVARARLNNMTALEQREVLALLDVRVDVVANATRTAPAQLAVRGAVSPALLLQGADASDDAVLREVRRDGLPFRLGVDVA